MARPIKKTGGRPVGKKKEVTGKSKFKPARKGKFTKTSSDKGKPVRKRADDSEKTPSTLKSSTKPKFREERPFVDKESLTRRKPESGAYREKDDKVFEKPDRKPASLNYKGKDDREGYKKDDKAFEKSDRKPASRSYKGKDDREGYKKEDKAFEKSDRKPASRSYKGKDDREGYKKDDKAFEKPDRKPASRSYKGKDDREGYKKDDKAFEKPDRKPTSRSYKGKDDREGYKKDDKAFEKPDRKPASRSYKGKDDREGYKKDDKAFEKSDRKPASRNYKGKDDSEGYKRDDRPFEKPDRKPAGRSTYKGKEDNREGYRKEGRSFEKPDRKPYGKPRTGERSFEDKGSFSRKKTDGDSWSDKPAAGGYKKREYGEGREKRPYKKFGDREFGSYTDRKKKGKTIEAPKADKPISDEIRLNRYLSNAGIASRREADKLIEAGLVRVNGEPVTELGVKIKPGDVIVYNGRKIVQEKRVYILLNKPKDYITTTDDPDDRKTVMDLLKGVTPERVYPVGRLDRNTTGVLLLTNDGDLAQKLTHPRYGIKKVYIAILDKPMKPADLHQLANGVELEDGPMQPDAVEYMSDKDKSVIFVEIHSGRNRIVHRMFESLGYFVDRLDRTSYGGLTKTGLKKGEHRFLSDKEVNLLRRL